jgi:hypothetical protein
MRIITGICGFALLLAAAGVSDAARAEGLGPGGFTANGGEYIPVYPPYPYRAGHYPKADWYYDLPPYVAIDPSFYRRRYFMMAQERNRYRYLPHIFHSEPGDGIEDIDIQGIGSSLSSHYRD